MAYGFTRSELFAAVITALDGNTSAGANVWRYRTSEITPAQCPAIVLLPESAQATEREPDEQVAGFPEFFTKTFSFSLSLFYAEADGGQTDTAVDQSLDAFEEEVLAIMLKPTWHAALDGFETIESVSHTYADPGDGDRKTAFASLLFTVRAGRQYDAA